MKTHTQSRRTSCPVREAGFSIIEVLMATVLLAYSVASLDALFMAGSQRAAQGAEATTARLLAREIHVLAQLLPKEMVGAAGVTSPEDVVSLRSLDGAVFSPPILADLTSNDDFADWTQSVSVTIADLDDTAATPRTLDALVDESSSLFRVEVTVSRLGVLEGEFSWMIRP